MNRKLYEANVKIIRASEKRELWMLAAVLETTADAQEQLGNKLRDHLPKEMADSMCELADHMRVAAEQIMEGRYGDPGIRPEDEGGDSTEVDS